MSSLTSLRVILLLTTIAPMASAQLPFYYPDGKPYKRKAVNINDINSDFGPCGLVKLHTPFCSDQPSADCLTTVGDYSSGIDPLIQQADPLVIGIGSAKQRTMV